VCCGWHALTEDAYQARLSEFLEENQEINLDNGLSATNEQDENQEINLDNGLSATNEQDESDEIEREKSMNEEIESYRQQAMDLWFDSGGSCTGAKGPGTPNIN
jgi:hypothetical protein